jgi:hypothetical protein
MSIDWGSYAIVFATLLGPVFAVQAQRIVAKRSEARDRQLWLFRSLMNTRVGTLSVEHVNALNAVPVEFHAVKSVMQKWRTYLDHLRTQNTALDVWLEKRRDLYTDLLDTMAKFLGYEFDLVQLKNEIYAPQGHAELETEQQVIRRGIVELMKGERTLPLDVRSIAQDPEAMARIAALQNALTAWLSGETAPRVTTEVRSVSEASRSEAEA